MLMFTLAISCLTTSDLPWFMDLTFHIPLQYCSLQHQTLLSLPDTSTTEHRFCLGPDASFFLGLSVIAVYSSPVAYWVPSDPGGSSSGVISFCLFMMFVRFLSQEYWSGRHFLLQGTSFCQNSSLWFVHLGWPCMAWLIASLSCTSPFTMRRLWSMKRCSRDMD